MPVLTKFTPGPWEISKSASSINGARILSVDKWVASVTRKADKPFDQKIADAHLIAAAPELYEELERYVNAAKSWHECHHSGIVQCDLFCDGMAKAEAALKKARGEQ
jgi:hypothetical protein